MPLLPLTEDSFLFPGAVNSLVLSNGSGGALLVDTGLDESHARKLLREVQAAGLTPSAVLNTHSHADHHGSNAFILKRFPELTIWAPPLEAAIIRYPMLEPLYLYGALPPRELQSKFLLAPSSPAQALEPGTHTLGGVEVELLPVPGHAVEMYAVRRAELLYAADALFGPEPLQKHPLTFCADSALQKDSARRLGTLEGISITVPGHGDPTGQLDPLVALNLQSLERTTAAVLDACSEPGTADELLARVCEQLQVSMNNAGAVVLNRSVVSAHLTELLALGRVQLQVQDNRMLFGRTGA
ncbi:MBL fold metallo-hydrolase [Deinococcus sonorensis]|uniref:MBL fold metallo-hydrolase n=2 Tax=Deinococcus sonorensis TaxID=309891 RepID=A0AAU7U7I8_9DEIO